MVALTPVSRHFDPVAPCISKALPWSCGRANNLERNPHQHFAWHQIARSAPLKFNERLCPCRVDVADRAWPVRYQVHVNAPAVPNPDISNSPSRSSFPFYKSLRHLRKWRGGRLVKQRCVASLAAHGRLPPLVRDSYRPFAALRDRQQSAMYATAMPETVYR